MWFWSIGPAEVGIVAAMIEVGFDQDGGRMVYKGVKRPRNGYLKMADLERDGKCEVVSE